ncbi:MAG TPA: hypothetical protein VF153_08445, partial [Candidatus Limnocylindria bacterium]
NVPTGEYLGQLRGTATATVAMSVVVLGIKVGLGHSVSNAVLLLLEVLGGAATFYVALRLVDPALLREMFRVAGHSIPGIARLRQWRQRRVADREEASREEQPAPVVPPIQHQK